MTELLNLNLYHFLMVLLRVGSALSLMPGFMTSYVNTQVKLSVALAICIVMMPVIAPASASPARRCFDHVLLYSFGNYHWRLSGRHYADFIYVAGSGRKPGRSGRRLFQRPDIRPDISNPDDCTGNFPEHCRSYRYLSDRLASV